MDKIGVALIGYGLAGKVFHGMLAKEVDDFEIRAIQTTHPERQAQAKLDFPSATIYEDYDQVLADASVNLIIIGTPHETHRDLSIRASNAGKHVVVDKIMALNAKEADDMIEAAKANDVLLSVFHNRRWDSDYLTVKHAIESGLLGEIFTVESSVVGFRPIETHAEPTRWREKKAHGGGPFRDWGAHLMDQAVQLFGTDIESITADFQYRMPGFDVETAAVCDMRFKGGVRYRVEVGSISKIGRPRWYIRGSKGALVVHGLDPQEYLLKQGIVASGTQDAAMPEDAFEFESVDADAKIRIFPGEYGVFYQNVADAIVRGASLHVDPQGVRDVLKVMDIAMMSAAQ